MLSQRMKEPPKQRLDEVCYNTGKEDNAMAVYAIDSNKVFCVSKERLKKMKPTPSPEWKKVQEFCAHHDIEIVTDPKTGESIVKVIDLE